MIRPLSLKAIASGNRHSTIDEVKTIINRHGWVEGFTPFSDLALALRIGIEERDIPALLNDLRQLLEFPEVEESFRPEATRERRVLLNITFTDGTGELRTEIADVPG